MYHPQYYANVNKKSSTRYIPPNEPYISELFTLCKWSQISFFIYFKKKITLHK